MSTEEIGRKLVSFCQHGRNLEALDTLYDKNAESIEAMSTPDMPAQTKGVDAIKRKGEQWFASNDVHGSSTKGPFPNGERFAVIYDFDVTPKKGPMAGKRMKMEEVGMYTVKNGKIVREEFYYSMG